MSVSAVSNLIGSQAQNLTGARNSTSQSSLVSAFDNLMQQLDAR